MSGDAVLDGLVPDAGGARVLNAGVNHLLVAGQTDLAVNAVLGHLRRGFIKAKRG